jgi:nitrogen fixation protein FixH
MRQDRKRPREFTGRHMLILVLAFFGVVIAVNGALAIFAASTWTGLLARNGYVASQDYNEVLAAADRQRREGWQSDFVARPDGLQFILRDAASLPLDGLSVTAHIGRRTHESEDRDLVMENRGEGHYAFDGAIGPGAWRVEIFARHGEQLRYRRIFDVTVPGDG